jgi:carboxyl-terminal processing protease
MIKRKYLYFSLPIIFLGLVGFKYVNDKYFEISKNIEIFSNLYKEINTHYVDELDPGSLMKIGADAIMESLDPYTTYWSETQIEGFQYLVEGKFDGIGANTKKIGDYVTITEVYKNSPAIKAGLKAGDQFLMINGADAKGKSKSDVLKFLKGAPGTEIEIQIARPGTDEPMDIAVKRGGSSVPNVPYSGFVSDNIGYISLTTFTNNAGRNVANALRDLKTENPDITGVVLDLRGNGGGLLREAINVSNVFIDKGEEVVSTRGKVKDWDNLYSTRNEPVDKEIRVAVLINKSSASASEIVSGVLQDLDRGVLVGQKSYGKGLVQNTKDIGYNAKIKLTTAKYYIPSGRCIQSVEYENGEPKDIPDEDRAKFKTRNGREVLDGGGVKPDIAVDPPKSPTIVKRLQGQNIIFNYVTEFVLKNPTIDSADQFTFTDYKDFTSFVKKSDFKYNTETEKVLKRMEKVVAEEDLNEPLKKQLESMKKLVEVEKEKHLDLYKDEIVHLIERDIVSRYYYQYGKIRNKLKNDPELARAIEVLNGNEYSEALNI